jgi:hypothetical protein
MKWYEWNTQAEFDTWHNALCAELGYPLVSVNQASGEPDETATKTTAYTTSNKVNNKVIADVEDQYAEGLTLTNLRLPERLQH